MLILAALVLAGCAAPGGSGDRDQRHGFYGGIIGGMSAP
jgi:hypothetical protein